MAFRSLSSKVRRFLAPVMTRRRPTIELGGQEELSALDRHALIRVIYVKSERPESNAGQREVLLALSKDPRIGLSHQVNASIAHAHKAMEAADSGLVREAIAVLNDQLGQIPDIGISDGIREDRTHIAFSARSILWHLYLFEGDFEQFLAVGDASFSVYQALSRTEVTRGFYQTVTNVVRCLAIAYLSALARKDAAAEQALFDTVEDSLFQALMLADDDRVKFKEYLWAAAVFTTLQQIRPAVKAYLAGRAPLRLPVVRALMRYALRAHGMAAWQTMTGRIDAFHAAYFGESE